ncbi:MAG: ABC transporter ATP-binding protein [Planctomycetota bacterium]|nr:MAG: ABC transporter ATP-binding protein [Planctomycetota bacterium]
MALVALEAVTKSYGETPALRDVTLRIEDGEVVTLLGPSGGGKTTLLRIMAGLEKPDFGTVTIGSEVVSDNRTLVHPRKRGVGMVFQDLGLWPHVTVEASVRLTAEANKVDVKIAGELIEMVGLGDKAMRYPHQLSGGEQQRLALARALAGEPEVLLLDEPLANLDAPLREDILAILSELHRRRPGMAIVAASHQQEEAIEFSSRLAILADGRIEQCAPAEDIFKEPASRLVAAFFRMGLLIPATPNCGRVKTPFGDLEVDADSGAQGWVLVRSEQLEPVPEGSQDNAASGIVQEKIFRGNVAGQPESLYRVKIGDIITRVPLSGEFQKGAGISLRVNGPVKFLEK